MNEPQDPIDHDAQDIAELTDEEALGGEDAVDVHAELLGPDEGGNDDVAELVGEFVTAEGPVSPEDAAIHVEDVSRGGDQPAAPADQNPRRPQVG